MKPHILIIITSDPRLSPRPAEAVRIAAGVAVWGKVHVTIYLRGDAIFALAESVDDLQDEENFTRYWPVAGESGVTVYVEKAASALAKIGQPTRPMTEISDHELGNMAAQQKCVLRF